VKKPVETEIKLRFGGGGKSGLGQARALLRRHGFEIAKTRVFEQNLVLDDDRGSLRQRGMLLRVRTAAPRSGRKSGAGRQITCTFKGPETPGRHKSREEREFTASEFEACLAVFAGLGYREVFRYEKYRTEFARGREAGHVTLDETPIGIFMELEGPARWIDATAKEFGFPPSAYVTESYGRLFERWKEETGSRRADMRFE
jgi:adenylate cyclase class 2